MNILFELAQMAVRILEDQSFLYTYLHTFSVQYTFCTTRRCPFKDLKRHNKKSNEHASEYILANKTPPSFPATSPYKFNSNSLQLFSILKDSGSANDALQNNTQKNMNIFLDEVLRLFQQF